MRRVEQRRVIRNATEEGDITPDNSSGELLELLTEAAAGLSCMVFPSLLRTGLNERNLSHY